MTRDQQKMVKYQRQNATHIHMNQNPKTQTIYIIIEIIRQQKQRFTIEKKT
jgi:hypothetical protein